MNFTDAPQSLFTGEIKPGVDYGIPWLDDASPDIATNTENVNQNDVQSNGDALADLTDYSVNPATSLMELQKNFTTYDTDQSQSLSFEELTAASTQSAAAKWALSKYRPLSQVATENGASGGIEQTEDFFARMQASRHVPIELGGQLFQDSIPSMLGISKQDLKTSLDFTDSKAISTLLEASAASEKKSGWGYLAASLVAGGLAYPFYKLCSKIHPVVGVFGGLLSTVTGVTQLGHYNARRNAKDTFQLEEQINKTRKMLGMDEIAPVVHPGKKNKEKDEKDTKNKDAKTEQNNNASDIGDQTLTDQSQIR